MENPNVMREKIEIIFKINLIYDLKLKSNVIRRNIKRKIWMLTWYSTRNDPIDCQIKGFSFCNFEDDLLYSRSEFPLFSPQNLIFKHSLDAEIDIEDKESKRFKDWDV